MVIDSYEDKRDNTTNPLNLDEIEYKTIYVYSIQDDKSTRKPKRIKELNQYIKKHWL